VIRIARAFFPPGKQKWFCFVARFDVVVFARFFQPGRSGCEHSEESRLSPERKTRLTRNAGSQRRVIKIVRKYAELFLSAALDSAFIDLSDK